jgi:uncharacterized protein
MAAPSSSSILPFPLAWLTPPAAPPTVGPATLAIAAGPRTDLFADPGGDAPVRNAPLAVGTPQGDFQLAARVAVDFAAPFDAGALVVWVGERTWAKLAFERSPQGDATVVTVVTRGVSDDCNAFAVAGASVWLRVARRGETFAFHASFDGGTWWLVRYFTLDGARRADVGFLAQSPRGSGTTATFHDIRWSGETLADLRDGS